MPKAFIPLCTCAIGFLASSAFGQVGGCDPDLIERSKGFKVPYNVRGDNPDACCEGQFDEAVSGQTQPRVFLVECSEGERPKVFSKSHWVISWPGVPGKVLVQGRHLDFAQRYRIDAERPGAVSGQTSGSFRWDSSRALVLGYEPRQVLFTAWVNLNPVQAESKDWAKIPPGASVHLPLRIEAAKVSDAGSGAKDPNDAAHGRAQPEEPASRSRQAADEGSAGGPAAMRDGEDAVQAEERLVLRLNLAANKQLDGVTIRAERLDAGADAGPFVLRSDITLSTRAQLIKVDKFQRGDGLIALRMTCRQNGADVEIDPIYVLLPPKSASPANAIR
jgi:hypothetical protein